MSTSRTPPDSSRTSVVVRLALGAVGALIGLYGGWLLLSRQELAGVFDAGLWLAAGAVVHDAVIAPLVLVLALAARRLPTAYRRASTVLVVVLGSLTLLAIPVLGRFGARSDNATLLDRPYAVSWLVVVVASVVASVLVVLVAARLRGSSGGRSRPGDSGVSGSDSNTRSV